MSNILNYGFEEGINNEFPENNTITNWWQTIDDYINPDDIELFIPSLDIWIDIIKKLVEK